MRAFRSVVKAPEGEERPLALLCTVEQRGNSRAVLRVKRKIPDLGLRLDDARNGHGLFFGELAANRVLNRQAQRSEVNSEKLYTLGARCLFLQ